MCEAFARCQIIERSKCVARHGPVNRAQADAQEAKLGDGTGCKTGLAIKRWCTSAAAAGGPRRPCKRRTRRFARGPSRGRRRRGPGRSVSPGNADLSKIDRRRAESDSVSQHEFETMAAVEVGACRESDLKILCLAGKKEDDLGIGGRQSESRRNRRIHQTHALFSKPGDLSRLVVDPQPNFELAMVLGGGFRDGIRLGPWNS